MAYMQGDHSPDDVKFRCFTDDSRHSSMALGMLSVTNMPVLVLNTCMDPNMQFTVHSFMQLFPVKIFSRHFHDF